MLHGISLPHSMLQMLEGNSICIWIVDMILFQPPTTTRMISSALVKRIDLFTMLQSFLRTHKETKSECFTLLSCYVHIGISIYLYERLCYSLMFLCHYPLHKGAKCVTMGKLRPMTIGHINVGWGSNRIKFSWRIRTNSCLPKLCTTTNLLSLTRFLQSAQHLAFQ